MSEDPRWQNNPVYACQTKGCRREIRFSNVEYMGKIDGDSFYLQYKCPCKPGVVLSQTFQLDHGAVGRLLRGLRPRLPYSAAPGESEPLNDDEERAVRIFRWECEHLESVAEFELLATRPLWR